MEQDRSATSVWTIMMPVIDLSGLAVYYAMMLAAPAMFGMLTTILASSAGAEARVRLSRGRHLCATLVGISAGKPLILGGLVAGWYMAPVGCMVNLLAPLFAGLFAYQTAKFTSQRLTRYRCKCCGASFRSTFPASECMPCTQITDQNAVDRALHELSDKIRGV